MGAEEKEKIYDIGNYSGLRERVKIDREIRGIEIANPCILNYELGKEEILTEEISELHNRGLIRLF
jgi:hypothetical protein